MLSIGVLRTRGLRPRFALHVLHGLPDVTLQSTRHEVILHGLREVTSERQVISHDPSVTSMIFFLNGLKWQETHNTFYSLKGFRVNCVLALVSFLCYCMLQRHLFSIKFSRIMAYFKKRKLSFMTDLIS